MLQVQRTAKVRRILFSVNNLPGSFLVENKKIFERLNNQRAFCSPKSKSHLLIGNQIIFWDFPNYHSCA
jgi:hypothetical protein